MGALVTGGAGFIGCNVADALLAAGKSVTVFDNLSRRGTALNLEWLIERHGQKNLRFIKGDIRDYSVVRDAVDAKTEAVYHLAGQVAVTTSVKNPRNDFETNALGTLNVLEAVRAKAPDAVLIYSSTNKVYGGLEHRQLKETDTRYELVDCPHGISENEPLDFHSPYGCSKGCSDQYVRDYSRIYGLRTVVMRQSCIYGVRQFGIEDQGWVAYFALAARFGRPITIYGNGKQVRDLLYIDDLVSAFGAVLANIDKAAGQVYNIGGGPEFAISIWKDFGPMLEKISGARIDVTWNHWRPGDQGIYVSDVRKAAADLKWKPTVSVDAGLGKLWAWISDNEAMLRQVF